MSKRYGSNPAEDPRAFDTQETGEVGKGESSDSRLPVQDGITQYIRPSNSISPFETPDDVFNGSLDEEGRCANLLLHRFLRRQREYKLCVFCSTLQLEFAGPGPWQVVDEDPILGTKFARIAWHRFDLNADVDDTVKYLKTALDSLFYTAHVLDGVAQLACPLCEAVQRIVAHIWKNQEGAEDTMEIADHMVERMLNRFEIGVLGYVKFSSFSVRFLHGNLSTRIDVFAIPSDRSPEPKKLENSAASSDRNGIESSDELEVVALDSWVRVLPDTFVDWAKVTAWFQDLPALDQPRKIQDLQGFRLIDVKAKCIVQPPANSRFAALSYVWGDCEQFSLQGDNVRMLEEEGSLEKVADELSLVVKDALSVCSKLAIPYLWVDSLCIVQDDAAGKHSQISSMDIIYSTAYITIVDGYGTDANSGLSRVSKPSKTATHHVVIDGCTFAVAENPFYSFDRSKWTSRGWTFQELIFSSRLLIFTDMTTIFYMPDEFQAESLFIRGTRTDIRYGPLQGNTLKRCNEFKRQYTVGLDDSIIRRILNEYHYRYLPLVKEFLSRELSRGSDVEDAFAGIIHAESEYLGDCRHGLPVSIFARALLWRHQDTIDQEDGYYCPRRPGFPSWSWMGWEGRQGASGRNQVVDMADSATGSGDDFSTMIYIYGFDTAKKLIRLLGDRSDREEGYHIQDCHSWARFSQFHPIEEEPLLSMLPILDAPLSHYIIFWASCATFPVSFTPICTNNYGYGDYEMETIGRLGVSVRLSSDWRANQPKDLEFVAIAGGSYGAPHMILIERRNEIAYRVAIHSGVRITASEWIARNPERKLITLG